MGGDSAPGGEYAREASDEERAFHAAQHQEPREEPREAREPREQRNEGSQAPLDLPPPPAAKPFVVWSSSPSGDPGSRRDE